MVGDFIREREARRLDSRWAVKWVVGCFDRRSGEGLKDELGRGWLGKRWAVEWAVGCFDRQSGERLKDAKVDRGWLDNRWVGQWVGPTLRVPSCAQQNGRPNSIQR